MTDPDAMDMIRAASWLAEEARLAQKAKRHSIHLPIRTAERLADVLLAAVNRYHGSKPDQETRFTAVVHASIQPDAAAP